jgi:hypothetical protein
MFRPMKVETIKARDHRRAIELGEARASFESLVASARVQYPQFAYPDTLPESNVLYLEAGACGPKGYPEALSISATRVKYEVAF